MKPHRSATQLDMWRRCHRQWAFRYLENLKIPPNNANLHTGIGFHAGAEVDMTRKLKTEHLAELQEVQDGARDGTNRAFEEQGITLSGDDLKKGEKKIKGEAVDTAVKLATHFHIARADQLNPVAVEQQWKLIITDWPVDYIGFVDCRNVDGTIIDFKTTAKTPSGMEQNHLVQLSLYGYWAKQKFGVLPMVEADYFVKKKEPEHHVFRRQLEEIHLQNLRRMLEEMEDGISREHFTPAPPMAWWCSKKACGYWSRCEYVK